MTPSKREEMLVQQRKFFNEYYGFLVGATCTKAEIGPPDDEGDEWPKLTFAKVLDAPLTLDGTRYIKGEQVTFEVEVSRDEEGNGPGFLYGLPAPEPTP